MMGEPASIEIIGLVSKFHAPAPAPPRTRAKIPSGYGTREQCRPFVAASGLGLSVPSPFAWGYCLPNAVPPGARAFRSPISGGCKDRCFYVIDDSDHGFVKNQYQPMDSVRKIVGQLIVPGLSFFNRTDQQTLVKLHLPYIFRTEEGFGLLFAPTINRPARNELILLSGLVETGWYADSVNLVFELPDKPHAISVDAGEPLAQVFPVPLAACRSDVQILEPHKRKTRDTLSALADWKVQHDVDRSAYKRLAKQHLVID